MQIARWLAVSSMTLCGCSTQLSAVSGGQPIQAAGIIRTDARHVGSFARVRLEGFAGVTIQIGAKPNVAVTAEENIIPLITTEVKGDTLIIGTKQPYTSWRAAKVEIVMSSLDGIDCAGSGAIMVTGLKAKSFEAKLGGSGLVKADGSADSELVNLSGSGQIDLEGLHATSAKVDLSGSGQTKVYVSQSLDAHLSGSGEIVYHGNPAKLTKDVSGSGAITAR